MCSVHALVTNGIMRMGELADQPGENFTAEFVAIFSLVSGKPPKQFIFPESGVNTKYFSTFCK